MLLSLLVIWMYGQAIRITAMLLYFVDAYNVYLEPTLIWIWPYCHYDSKQYKSAEPGVGARAPPLVPIACARRAGMLDKLKWNEEIPNCFFL